MKKCRECDHYAPKLNNTGAEVIPPTGECHLKDKMNYVTGDMEPLFSPIALMRGGGWLWCRAFGSCGRAARFFIERKPNAKDSVPIR